ncbi:C40 family peptidase [Heliomicrobium modesticaldum]|uniref:C40 family peptidase n=1 Tax=Heliomicrobium modesticaldum TaxID=35701 RepID=UPI00164F5722|nr:C40 family peptidase [Heliomicrobium modesticaldum]
MTQGWLGSLVEFADSLEIAEPGWRKIRLPDQGGYEGWVREDDLVPVLFATNKVLPLAVIAQPFIEIERGGFLQDRGWLPMGARFPLLDRKEGFVALQMPQGTPCWIPEEAIRAWPSDVQTGEEALLLAAKFLGRPYLWGGMGWPGIDCSGLVFIAFWTLGIMLPRDAKDQWALLEAVDEANARPGDLIFFSRRPPLVDHVGLVAGKGVFLHASSSLGGVAYSDWREQRWRERLFGFRRSPV